MTHRYAYYANNNIFDAPNAISEYSMIPSQTECGDEILRETTVRLCQISSDSLFLSIFYKKGATLYSTRRTKIMEDRSGKQTSAY